MRFHNMVENRIKRRGGAEREWIARGAWESTRSRFRNPTVMAENERRPCINRLFGNIVGEQISEKHARSFRRNDIHFGKTALPTPSPFLFLPIVSHGRDALILFHRDTFIHRWPSLHLRNTR